MFSLDLKDRVAWVSGGSRGIGRSSALLLAEAGCNVAITYKSNVDAANAVVEQIEKMGRKAIATKADVSSFDECSASYSSIVSLLGEVDILVTCAGITLSKLFLNTEDADWDALYNTNIKGTKNPITLVGPSMMQKRRGKIITISSVASIKANYGQAAYAVTKGGIESLTRCLAVELGRYGITVNCISPGMVLTDMISEFVAAGFGDKILEKQIIKRFAEPKEIAYWVVFLASECSDYMTGQIIYLDGGVKMP